MNISLNLKLSQRNLSTAFYDAVGGGAGPYGLSIAAHLKGQGLKVACFGKPIQFWREQMPGGMYLRSFWWATSLSDPEHTYGIEKYLYLQGIQPTDPLPIRIFINYGIWFQQQVDVILGTGYHADITRLPMLHSSLAQAIHIYKGSPILNNRFESNISGLYFTGFTAMQSLGPYYRFVVGADAVARRIARAVARQVARVR